MYLWPFRILPPLAAKWSRIGASLLGPLSIDGAQQQATRTDGGGLWRLDCSFEATSRDAILALRAWDSYLDAGTVEFLMPVLDLAFAPRPISAGKFIKPGKPQSASDPFSESGDYSSALMIARLVGSSVLRATSAIIGMQQGSSVKAGQVFSVNHPTAGWRKYNVQRVSSVDGDQFSVSFRPPFREAVSNGTLIEFDVPRCVMRLHPDSATDLAQSVDLLKIGSRVSASFIESFG
jgi:hypothetical protein